MTAILQARTIHHAADRHHHPSRAETVVAITSYLLQPVRVVVDWAAAHPEAVILPALAVIWWWAGFLDVAVLLAAAGAVVVVVVMRADARRGVELLIQLAQDDHDVEEVASG